MNAGDAQDRPGTPRAGGREAGGVMVVVVGSVNSDFVAKGERLPRPGETVRGDTFEEAAGGKGANQALATVRLGARALLIAMVGTDARAAAILDGLAAEGVDVTRVGRASGAQTGAALVLIDAGGEKQIMAAAGANRLLREADVEGAREAIGQADVLLAQLEVPVAAVHRALRIAGDAGVKTVLDPAPAVPLADELLRLVDVIRPNASEAAALTGLEVTDRASAARAARSLLARGPRAAIVQAGDEGDVLVTGDDEVFLPRHEVQAVDATGAGDAFAAAVAVGLAEGRQLAESAALGSAAAALATTRLGAQAGLPTRDEVARLLSAPPGGGPR